MTIHSRSSKVILIIDEIDWYPLKLKHLNSSVLLAPAHGNYCFCQMLNSFQIYWLYLLIFWHYDSYIMSSLLQCFRQCTDYIR
ncbi:hypothetical protein D3C80_1656670 [compost metagenome]